MQGWFHGHGVFWRADGMKYEGEFRGGRVWGLGKKSIFWTTISGFHQKLFQTLKMQ